MLKRETMRFLLGGSAVVLSLAIGTLPPTVADSVDSAALYRIVTAYFYAVGENRFEQAMSFYHRDSPQADEERRELEFGQSGFLQRTYTVSIDLIHHDGQRAVVVATHRHLKIAGIKFMEVFAESRYVLHRQGDAWKIWSRVDRPLRHRLRKPWVSP